MIQFWIKKCHKNWLRSTAAVVCFSFLFSTLSAPFAQASLWEERRKAVEDLKKSDPVQLASLPSVSALQTIVGNGMMVPGQMNTSLAPEIDSSNSQDLMNQILQKVSSRKTHSKKFNQIPAELLQKIESFGEIERVHLAHGQTISLNRHSDESRNPVLCTKLPLIIQIQDAHGIQSVQSNIAHILWQLMDMGVEIVGVEGSQGKMERLEEWRKFPDRSSLVGVAGYLMKEGFLSGVEIAGLDRDQENVEFYGVEDKEKYLEQVKSFKETLAYTPEVEKWRKESKKRIEASKEKIYTSELKELDQQKEKYESGKIKLGEWVAYLGKIGTDPKGSVPIFQSNGKLGTVPNFHALSLYSQAYHLEKSLDFKKLEQEQKSVLTQLSQKLEREELLQLLEESLAYRLGKIGYSEFYTSLKRRTLKSRIPLSPEIERYIQYVTLVEGIDRNNLFQELKNLEKTVWNQILNSTASQQLYKQDQDFTLIEKALDFKLNVEDWKEFQKFFISPLPSGERVRVRGSKEVQNVLANATKFNQLSEERNQIFTHNLHARMEEKNSKISVLVAGGYHSEGVEETLKEKGISYITIRPRMDLSEIKEGYNPLQAFRKTRIPLEEIFTPEKVSLAPSQITGSAFGLEDSIPVIEEIKNTLLESVQQFRSNPSKEFIKRNIAHASGEVSLIISKNNLTTLKNEIAQQKLNLPANARFGTLWNAKKQTFGESFAIWKNHFWAKSLITFIYQFSQKITQKIFYFTTLLFKRKTWTHAFVFASGTTLFLPRSGSIVDKKEDGGIGNDFPLDTLPGIAILISLSATLLTASSLFGSIAPYQESNNLLLDARLYLLGAAFGTLHRKIRVLKPDEGTPDKPIATLASLLKFCLDDFKRGYPSTTEDTVLLTQIHNLLKTSEDELRVDKLIWKRTLSSSLHPMAIARGNIPSAIIHLSTLREGEEISKLSASQKIRVTALRHGPTVEIKTERLSKQGRWEEIRTFQWPDSHSLYETILLKNSSTKLKIKDDNFSILEAGYFIVLDNQEVLRLDNKKRISLSDFTLTDVDMWEVPQTTPQISSKLEQSNETSAAHDLGIYVEAKVKDARDWFIKNELAPFLASYPTHDLNSEIIELLRNPIIYPLHLTREILLGIAAGLPAGNSLKHSLQEVSEYFAEDTSHLVSHMSPSNEELFLSLIHKFRRLFLINVVGLKDQLKDFNTFAKSFLPGAKIEFQDVDENRIKMVVAWLGEKQEFILSVSQMASVKAVSDPFFVDATTSVLEGGNWKDGPFEIIIPLRIVIENPGHLFLNLAEEIEEHMTRAHVYKFYDGNVHPGDQDETVMMSKYQIDSKYRSFDKLDFGADRSVASILQIVQSALPEDRSPKRFNLTPEKPAGWVDFTHYWEGKHTGPTNLVLSFIKQNLISLRKVFGFLREQDPEYFIPLGSHQDKGDSFMSGVAAGTLHRKKELLLNDLLTWIHKNRKKLPWSNITQNDLNPMDILHGKIKSGSIAYESLSEGKEKTIFSLDNKLVVRAKKRDGIITVSIFGNGGKRNNKWWQRIQNSADITYTPHTLTGNRKFHIKDIEPYIYQEGTSLHIIEAHDLLVTNNKNLISLDSKQEHLFSTLTDPNKIQRLKIENAHSALAEHEILLLQTEPKQLNLFGLKWWQAALLESPVLGLLVFAIPIILTLATEAALVSVGAPMGLMGSALLMEIFLLSLYTSSQWIAGKIFTQLHVEKGIRVGMFPFTLHKISFGTAAVVSIILYTSSFFLSWALVGGLLAWTTAYTLGHLARNFHHREEDRIREIKNILREIPYMNLDKREESLRRLELKLRNNIKSSRAVEKKSQEIADKERTLLQLGELYTFYKNANTVIRTNSMENRIRNIVGAEISVTLNPEALLSQFDQPNPFLGKPIAELPKTDKEETLQKFESSFIEGAATILQAQERMDAQDNKLAPVRIKELQMDPQAAHAFDLTGLLKGEEKAAYLTAQIKNILSQKRAQRDRNEKVGATAFASNFGNKKKLLNLLKEKLGQDLWKELDQSEFFIQKRLNADQIYTALQKPAEFYVFTENDSRWEFSRWATILVILTATEARILRSLQSISNHLQEHHLIRLQA